MLYPSRAADAPRFEAPPERLSQSGETLTVAFAGTINLAGCVRSLQQLAECLEKVPGRLLVFGPFVEADAVAAGLRRSNIELRGMVPSGEMMKRLRAEADVLFVPNSFAPGDREYSALSFPSKLTDYTAAGLPLLIQGPDYCSAVRWARDNPGVADVVTQDTSAAIEAAFDRLKDRSYRKTLTETSLLVGNKCFSHAAAQHVFFNALAFSGPCAALNSQPSTVNRPS